MEILKFVALCVFQMGVAFCSWQLCAIFFGIFATYFICSPFFRKPFLRFLWIYLLSLLFFLPLLWIERHFFEYDLRQSVFLLILYMKSFLSLCFFLVYKKYTSLLEFMYVLEKLKIPPLFLLGTLFILLFSRRFLQSLTNIQIAYSLRIRKKNPLFLAKVLTSVIQNLFLFSLSQLSDLHAMVVLRKLNRPLPFSLLYQSEKQYKRSKETKSDML